MADSPRRRYTRSSRSPSPYKGRQKAMSRSRSPVARSQSRSPSPDPRSQARSRSRSPGSREPEAVNHGNTLYITGLSSRVTDKELREYFNKEGKVVSCHVVLEPHTRVSRGFAFITMDTVEDAERCIKYLNQSEMQGRNITVEKSRRGRPRTPTPGSYLGHRYERREMQRGGGGRFRRGGYGGRDDYYGGNSYRRSPPPMYSSYRDTRDYPPYRDARDYSPPPRDGRDYYDSRGGGRGYSPQRSPPPYGGRARRERSRSLPYSPYRMPERGYGSRRAGGGGYDR
ncbi:serine/arginine-rich splicing factor SR45a-like isoform X1 [Lolium rigidum]|uniref:serine/arginine-rich splicing factor SR45a-like isoform X1 n=1 Tax=Lolium rigidum TaxID=89674 RepID=UPI001F5CB73C|nr:serine/arginine-rich splicing factor SR45a-like isoform X1 [Lolium rigidum]